MNSQSTPLFTTLYDVLRYRASTASGCAAHPAFTYLNDGETVNSELSFAQLDEAARKLAARLQKVTRPGDRVLLVYPPSIDYIIAFYGCVYAGVIAVPALPPANPRTLPRLRLMAADATPAAVLTFARIRDSVAQMTGEAQCDEVLAGLNWLATDEPDTLEAQWTPPTIHASDIVFLQYTSGSTGAPKGVMVAHHNVMANAAQFSATFGLSAGDAFVFWLPPHHDFGLIGSIIMPVYIGAHSVQFPPAAFVMRPYRWLELISRYRGRFTGAPNFAYQLCVQKISEDQKKTLDLSCLDVAVNGAERIRLESVQQFADAFSGCGLKRETMTPAYGMAESVLFATAAMDRSAGQLARSMRISKTALESGRVERCTGFSDSIDIVSTGNTRAGDHVVKVVDGQSFTEQPDEKIGEVWVSSDSVAQGYWGREGDEREKTFSARLPNNDRTWLRSGDLGYISAGELYITGRIKEIMIFNGRNIYPQDVEITVEKIDPAFRANGCAAFSLEDGETTGLVIIQEIESRKQPDTSTLIAKLRSELAEKHEIFNLTAILFVKSGRIPRTSSGKIQRIRCQQLYLTSLIDSTWSWHAADSAPSHRNEFEAPSGEMETTLAAIWQELLGLERVSRHDQFFESGGHSLLATQLIARVRAMFSVNVTLRNLFENPTLSGLAQYLQLGLIEPGPESQAIGKAASDALPTLSFAEQRLWFLEQLNAGQSVYNVAYALRLQGEVNIPALERSLTELVARHDALRTAFLTVNNLPVRRIAASLALPLDVIVLDVEASQVEEQLAQQMRAIAKISFDLESAPLLRTNLFRLNPECHALLFCMHHIISDGWSAAIFNRELASLYRLHTDNSNTPDNQSTTLPELGLQYKDFAQWEQRRFESGVCTLQYAQQLDYWQKNLGDAVTALALPTDFPRPALMSNQGDALDFMIQPATTKALKSLCRQEHATLFMYLASAFAVFLSRYAGQPELCIGTPVANRNHAGLENIIGFFVNTLVLRIGVDASQDFVSLLQQVRNVALDAFANQDIPFDQVVTAVNQQRHGGQSSLFQVMLVLQNTPLDELDFPGLTVHSQNINNGTAKFDLTLVVTEVGESLACSFEFSTDLFQRESIVLMARNFTRLLDGIVTQPNTPVGTLPLVSDAQRQQLVVGFNDTGMDNIGDQLIHQLFEKQAQAQPDATALIYENSRLSYAELNARANQLAHHLISLGVRPDDRVAICMERGLEMVVGLLGILKAGGAYVPLDPNYPQDRLAYMLADSEPVWLLTQSHLQAALPAFAATIVMSDIQGPVHNPDAHTIGLRADHLAYVIYTSGSTGKPKGVMNRHTSVCNLTRAQGLAFEVQSSSRVLQFASFSFDASVWEWAMALCHGAALYLVEKEGLYPGKPLADTLQRYQITHVTLPSSALQSCSEESLSTVTNLIVAGEACPPALARQYAGRHRFFNAYGPTETTVCATIYQCQTEAGSTVPIGRPIANTQIYILDSYGQPVPVGVSGEIYIGGAGVARGYLNWPELTAERFIPDPFSAIPARMYKTGDLGRWLNDGNIEYLGRNDYQVKIRGFRIELGEIEVALTQYAGVREAVVIAREDQPGDKRLVAYLTARDGAEPTAAELRNHLSSTLAEYMIPAAFVVLDSFPLTPNGKLDRKALPAPDASAVITRAYEAPAGEVEIAIAVIWQELLNLPRIGRHDHFFELGGHSLLAVRMIGSLRNRFNTQIPLRALFNAPTVADLANEIASITERVLSSTPEIMPVVQSDTLPLSFAQQRFWFLDQYQARNTFYSVPLALTLNGNVDESILQRALEALIARHSPLRTIFPMVAGRPCQKILPVTAFPLEFIDLSDLPLSQAQARAQEQIQTETSLPFDLAVGPLFRARLLRLRSDRHMLLLTLHHIIHDGWSTSILLGDLTKLYAAFQSDQVSPLAALAVQYSDYTVWEQAFFDLKNIEPKLTYWRDHLRDVPPLLDLPTDRRRPVLMTHRGATVQFQIPADRVWKLKAIAHERNATLFMTLTALVNVLLYRYCGQNSICVGVMSANRPTKTEALIGNFVNVIPVCTTIDADLKFADVLDRTSQNLLAAYDQQLPFEIILSNVAHERSVAYIPYAQVVLNFHNEFEWDSDATVGLNGNAFQIAGRQPDSITHAAFDLKIEITPVADALEIVLEYSTDLFDAASIRRWENHLNSLIDGVLTDASLAIGRLPLLNSIEFSQVIAGLNDTATSYPDTRLIHQLFEDQVERTPTAIAVLHDGVQLRYEELNARANQLAHHLINLGVKPDDRVGICMDRSLDMVVGLLGILKAGGAYLPLDTSYPKDRLDWMLHDGAPIAVLTQVDVRAMLPETNLPLIVVDAQEVSAQLKKLSTANPALLTLTAQHLAYVIYTSGSTGQPKGAMNEHSAVVNRLWWAKSEYDIQHDDGIVQKTPFGFDVSVWEFFLPLLSGARLIMARPGGHQDPHYLMRLIEQCNVTTIHFVPSMLQIFLNTFQPGRCPTLRRVLCSGEALPHAMQVQFQTQLPHTELHNLYGPTEAAVDVTYLRCAENSYKDIVPIGRPIANTQIYILDTQGQPVPVGVSGEIFIGGAGVARGYLNRPDLTAERFIPDPFSATPARLYKTGDLGRWLNDGNIEYLGRNDYQVKIRGFRIELGEIEVALTQYAGVREAVVTAREDQPGDKRLVAYLTAQDGAEPTAAELRNHLSSTLAEYMIPSAFVVLDAFPLTPNGKLDRKALPAPDASAVITRAYEAPAGEVEIAIALIWQELLNLPRIGRHDHFFELGGHSLLAVQMMTRLRQSLGVELALRDLFAQPVLAALAQTIAGINRVTQLAIVAADRNQVLPLSWSQQRLWFLDQLDHAAGAAYHLPAALQLTGELDRSALQRTLDRIVARHEVLRTSFPMENGVPVQRIAAPDAGMPLHNHDLNNLTGASQQQEVNRLAAEEAQAPFDLSQDPLIRARLVQLSAQHHILLLTQHHIISDGWSTGVLVKEMSTLYSAFRQGQSDPLPPLPIQYADYAVWQRNWLQGAVLESQLDFWKHRLQGAPSLLELPADHPRPPVQSYRGSHVRFTLPAELTSGLRQLSQRHGATLFMTLLAGWSVLLSRLSHQQDVVIGTPVANRPRRELEPLAGFFVNTLALRVQLSAEPTVAALLAQIKADTLSAYDHQDLPFEQVVEALQPPRSLSHSPLFQVMLAMNNTPGGTALDLAGLHISGIEQPSTTAHFDLTLSLSEEGELLQGSLEYASDLFDQSTVERMSAYLGTVLSGMVADDSQRVSRLPLLSAVQRQQVVTEFNATATDYPHNKLIHQLFEEQAHRQPDATALVYEDTSLSYGELNARANQLAHHLIGLGVKPDDRVAICMERSLEMVVGLLGILKAGGAYVPLDPGYPQDRLAYMLADSEPVLLLTQSHLQAALPAFAATIVMSDIQGPAHNPDLHQSGLTSRHLAYVMYTSGSTGHPKGVLTEHRNVVRLVINNHYAPLTEADCVAHCANVAFDASTWEIWSALLHGARVLVVPQSVLLDPAKFSDTLIRGGTTAMWLTSGLFNDYADALQTAFGQLRYLLIGGDVLDPHTVARVMTGANPPVHVINGYGPTESTTFAATCAIPPADGNIRAIPIGKPIANTQIYILDTQGQPVPVGVSGELFIGGAGVARGYLNRPELTAERFIPDPFSAAPARLYKTGDLGRWLNDGNIEYLGRNDYQVKIRGFRIELGEIEVALTQYAGVREAVVMAREDQPGDKRLVAYLTAQDGAEPTAAEMRTHLAATLAQYMIPSAFVVLDSFPLTPNGKLDRKALPAPDASAVITRAYEAPAGEVEIAIALIWQELLNLPRIGRHDHFFELGGHSLLAVQLLSRLRESFEIEISLTTIFSSAVLMDLADCVVTQQLAMYEDMDMSLLDEEINALSESEIFALLQESQS